MSKLKKRRVLYYRNRKFRKNDDTNELNFVSTVKSSFSFLIIESLAILAGLTALWVSIYEMKQNVEMRAIDREVARETLEEIKNNREFRSVEERMINASLQQINEGRVSTAWNTVASSVSGNSGKVEALTYLASQKILLIGLNVSCRAMGGIEQLDGKEICVRPPYLVELFRDLPEEIYLSADSEGAFFDTHTFSLESSNFGGANLKRANFVDVNLRKSNFSNADLSQADLTNAGLYMANFSGTSLYLANMSGANLNRVIFDEHTDLRFSWADINDPPRHLPDGFAPEYACKGTVVELAKQHKYLIEEDIMSITRDCILWSYQ